jgi:copper resistance protein C
MSRYRLGCFCLLALFYLATAGQAQLVAAHLALLVAEPPVAAVLKEPPPFIRLTFNEPLSEGSRLALFQSGLRPVAGVVAVIEPDAPAQLMAPLPPLLPDIYTVQWWATGLDGHTVSGSYQFSVEAAPAGLSGWWLTAVLLLIGLSATAVVVFKRWGGGGRGDRGAGISD